MFPDESTALVTRRDPRCVLPPGGEVEDLAWCKGERGRADGWVGEVRYRWCRGGASQKFCADDMPESPRKELLTMVDVRGRRGMPWQFPRARTRRNDGGRPRSGCKECV